MSKSASCSHHKLTPLFHSRLRISTFALIIQILIIIPFIQTPFFMVGIFNIPAIIALLACRSSQKLEDCRAQHFIKTALKVGIAKSIGGVLLFFYIGLKFLCIYNNADGNQKCTIGRYVAYFAASAVVDIVYSILAIIMVKKTKYIMKVLKRAKSIAMARKCHSLNSIQLKESCSCSTSSSSSCSGEETPRKIIHDNI